MYGLIGEDTEGEDTEGEDTEGEDTEGEDTEGESSDDKDDTEGTSKDDKESDDLDEGDLNEDDASDEESKEDDETSEEKEKPSESPDNLIVKQPIKELKLKTNEYSLRLTDPENTNLDEYLYKYEIDIILNNIIKNPSDKLSEDDVYFISEFKRKWLYMLSVHDINNILKQFLKDLPKVE